MILTLLLYIIRTLGNRVRQKHIIMNRLLLGVVLLLCSLLTFGQVPGAMSFQGVARDTEGNPLSEKTVSFKIEIVQGSEDGTVAYAETQRVKTAKNGVVNLQIGMGYLELFPIPLLTQTIFVLNAVIHALLESLIFLSRYRTFQNVCPNQHIL